jgi:sigma-B regulation protein RsbU (phosphoserine phosphatase)
MTLAYLVLDVAQRTVRWASAGHDPAIVYSPQRDAFDELDGAGIPLGIEPSWTYEDYGPRELLPGDTLVVGTDGIWESRNTANEMFGKERLRATIRSAARAAPASAAAISEAITSAVAAFRGTNAQDDDLTLVVIRLGEADDSAATA